ncbi:hypothetical protein GCM10023084_61710 [Streptomyces lacrimifluminis]|uniref:Uncharacterized protein n=1 Tax=Streptomyces lacrimifluminis TaxID=1500077 RepID=A0A917NZR2_9ACTN|nr:hypothetical protein [Streptomyces lacrimifluminis]GGJ44291.1 hypothetical protein GCM10012282_46550 [Streptomyces lacrimifluminis]
MAPGHVDVHVARGPDGTIRIAAGPGPRPIEVHDGVVHVGPDFTRAVLDVAGAVLTWPVLDAPGLPWAEVHDVGRAQQWVWALYGERVAAAVHDSAAGRGGVRVTAEATALAGAAARLGLGHWAARWWPASYQDGIPVLEPSLLGLELAALTHRCQQLFDDEGDQPDDCAAELIEEHLAALDPLIQWWRATAGSVDMARRLETVLRLIDDAADNAGLDGPALRHLRSSLEGRGPAAASADPGALFARRGGYALAAGEPLVTGGRVIARGSGINDWRRYPPGLVDAAESAVSWTARALGARRRIEVEALADPAAPATGTPLVAEVHVNGGAPHRVSLARRDDLWTGHSDLSPDPQAGVSAPRIEVGVLLPGFDPGPGAPGDADVRAGRDAVRALVRRRLAVARRPPAYDTPPHDNCSAPFLAETAATATDEDY